MKYYLKVPLILLAAGESKRMGSPKQLLPYKGSSLIRYTTSMAATSVCGPVIVVLGANSKLISPEINDLPIHISYNPQWQKGMSTSIIAGIYTLLAIKIDFDAIVLALADQPLITDQIYNRLVEYYYSKYSLAIASSYSGTFGVPALFDSTLLPELLNIRCQGGAKQILSRYSDHSSNLDLPEAAIDIDTPADYQKLLEI